MADGEYYLGQYKNGMREGFITYKDPGNGRILYYQFKNHQPDGYGIQLDFNGVGYCGEVKGDFMEGYGFFKYENDDEYDGRWKNSKRHGEIVYKEASTGRIERIISEEDEFLEVIEVIQEGQ